MLYARAFLAACRQYNSLTRVELEQRMRTDERLANTPGLGERVLAMAWMTAQGQEAMYRFFVLLLFEFHNGLWEYNRDEIDVQATGPVEEVVVGNRALIQRQIAFGAFGELRLSVGLDDPMLLQELELREKAIWSCMQHLKGIRSLSV
jgi:hypothetical protein